MSEPNTAGTSDGAPAAEFTLEAAFKEASAQATETVAAPSEAAQDSTDKATPESVTDTAEISSGEEPAKSNRQAGREAYERGLREGREAAAKEAAEAAARREAEQTATTQREQFNSLLLEANLPDDGTFETQQRRNAAQQKLGALYASNTVTQSAYQRGMAEQEQRFWGGFEGKLADLGLDQAGVTALMRAPSAMDFARSLVDHGKAQEKAVWEPEIAKRDATIEQLKGQLASRSPSPEPAGGLRTNGFPNREVKTIEDAYAIAQAMHAGS